jgi:hypothetical protein
MDWTDGSLDGESMDWSTNGHGVLEKAWIICTIWIQAKNHIV